MIWRLKGSQFQFPRPSLIAGILNVTPDSFSDGGRFLHPDAALQHARQLIDQGADILDVGGESTRPGAQPVPESEEADRVLPVIRALAQFTRIPISIDTYKPAVALAALKAGASLVNDIATNREDPDMARVLAQTGAGYLAVHMLGSPQSMQQHPSYPNVVLAVHQFFDHTLKRLAAAGVEPEQIALDVGIGFGKTVDHNLQLLAHLREFSRWNRPLVLGVSRKSFIGALTDAPIDRRLPGALAATCLGIDAGIQVVRTHDVPETRQALRMTEAIRTRRLP